MAGYAPRMENERMGFWDWVVAGFAFAIGMSAASALLGAFAFAVFMSGISASLKQARSSFDPPAIMQPRSSSSSYQDRSPIRRAAPRDPVPLSREECLAMTGGVANDEYVACRNRGLSASAGKAE